MGEEAVTIITNPRRSLLCDTTTNAPDIKYDCHPVKLQQGVKSAQGIRPNQEQTSSKLRYLRWPHEVLSAYVVSNILTLMHASLSTRPSGKLHGMLLSQSTLLDRNAAREPSGCTPTAVAEPPPGGREPGRCRAALSPPITTSPSTRPAQCRRAPAPRRPTCSC
jgi:hypothetical protein